MAILAVSFGLGTEMIRRKGNESRFLGGFEWADRGQYRKCGFRKRLMRNQ